MSKHSPYVPFRQLLRHPVHFLAFGFGSGCLPKMPGTWGSLASIPFWYVAHLSISRPALWVLWSVLCVFSIWVCHVTARDLGVHDHSGIVFDEFIGQWLVLLCMPPHLYAIFAAFVLFRVFDAWKPWPISWCDRNVSGGFGIVLDDVLAALLSVGVFKWGVLFF